MTGARDYSLNMTKTENTKCENCDEDIYYVETYEIWRHRHNESTRCDLNKASYKASPKK
jgi:hypothetical protein